MLCYGKQLKYIKKKFSYASIKMHNVAYNRPEILLINYRTMQKFVKI